MFSSVRPFSACRGGVVFAALASGFFASVQTASAAPVDAASAACRATLAKSVSKLANTTMKAFDSCIKAGIKGETVDCSDHTTADTKGAVDAARSKLDDSIASRCNDTTHAVALSELQRCGPPTGTAITGFANLPGCY